MEGFLSLDHRRHVAGKIVEAMEPPFALSDHSVQVSASIGVATAPPSSSWEEVLHAADSAGEVEEPGLGPGGWDQAGFKDWGWGSALV